MRSPGRSCPRCKVGRRGGPAGVASTSGARRSVGAAAAAHAGGVRARGSGRLVARDRRRLARGWEKGGETIGRSLRGRSGSRFHLAVDATGAPFAIRIGPGNENERLHLMALVDELRAAGRTPAELWADRGYDGASVTPPVTRARHRSDDQRALPSPRIAGRAGHAERHAREPSSTEAARCARQQALAGRAHEQPASELARGRNPLGAPTRALARRDSGHRGHDHLPNARWVFPLPAPGTGTGPIETRARLASPH